MKLKPVKARAAMLMEEIIEELAKSQGMTKMQVASILQFTYGFVADTMRAGELKGVRLRAFGTFAVKPYNKKRHEKDRTENKRGSLFRTTKRGRPEEANQEGSNNKSEALS